MVNINFVELNAPSKESCKSADTACVYLLADANNFDKPLKEVNSSNNNVISNFISVKKFEAKENNIVDVFVGGNCCSNVILAGVKKDDKSKLTKEQALVNLGAAIFDSAKKLKTKDVNIFVPKEVYGFNESEAASKIAYGFKLNSYNFDKYFTKKKDEDKSSVENLFIKLEASQQARECFLIDDAVAEGVFFARNLVSEPSNVLYPQEYANRIKAEMKPLKVKVEILGEKELTKIGMNALLGVGVGSEKESQVVIMRYNGADDKSEQPVVFVGKGVTFDTGGISIKPSLNMHEMKYDMGGSAAVCGAIKALAGRKAKVNAIGIVGLVENMPDGKAQRPGDVVTSLSGKTIEVLNTDAEGRLVLADILWYAKENFSPKFMIDLATLTGACVIALGLHRAGLMSNDDTLANNIFNAGENSGEKVWRLPMGEEYDKQMDSQIADMQNISNAKGAGTITAAQFLQRFVGETKWAHLDIAGVAWASKATPSVPEGAVGFGVRLLNRVIADYYEDK